MQKVWNIRKYDKEKIEKYKNDFKISEILAKILIAKNIEYDDIDMYLNGDLSYLRDPYGIKDMEKFVDRVLLAIENKEKICIYGDYDVDGITSITIMYKYLTEIGAIVSYYLPDRLIEGYGINNDAIDEIAKTGAKLIISMQKV